VNGQVFVVGTTDTVWTWDADTSAWIDTGIIGGDMLKAIYDVDANSIVDKAESVDDGAGNVTSGAEVKTAYDHSQIVTGNPHAIASTDIADFNTGVGSAIGTEDLVFHTPGRVGSGASWADAGLIDNMPAILFDSAKDEKSSYVEVLLTRISLLTVDPVVSFFIYSTTLPVLTTADDVRWQLEVRNIAPGNSTAGAADQTLLATQTLPTIATNSNQGVLTFTLDRTLMTAGETLLLVLSRLGTDAADNYTGDVGVAEASLLAEYEVFN
jgi:hypothetical protein